MSGRIRGTTVLQKQNLSSFSYNHLRNGKSQVNDVLQKHLRFCNNLICQQSHSYIQQFDDELFYDNISIARVMT